MACRQVNPNCPAVGHRHVAGRTAGIGRGAIVVRNRACGAAGSSEHQSNRYQQRRRPAGKDLQKRLT